MARAVDAVLFDLDGTLVDSLDLIAQAMSRVLVEHGYDTDVERLKPLIGPPMEVVARQLGASADAPALGEEYLRLYHDQYVRQTPERAGATALIERLVASGVALGIVTNKVEASAHELLRIEGWTAHFGAVVGRDTPGASAKPAPEPHSASSPGLPFPQATTMWSCRKTCCGRAMTSPS